MLLLAVFTILPLSLGISNSLTENAETSTSTNFNGPVSGDYEVIDNIPLASVIWSHCGAPVPLNIDSQVRLSTSRYYGTRGNYFYCW
jgi:hypothetical protein